MSRKGHYHGGNTSIGRRDASWFTKESVDAPGDDGKPDRLPTAPTLLLAAKNQQPELLKAGDPRIKKTS